jgi:hypothetical protein
MLEAQKIRASKIHVPVHVQPSFERLSGSLSGSRYKKDGVPEPGFKM